MLTDHKCSRLYVVSEVPRDEGSNHLSGNSTRCAPIDIAFANNFGVTYNSIEFSTFAIVSNWIFSH